MLTYLQKVDTLSRVDRLVLHQPIISQRPVDSKELTCKRQCHRTNSLQPCSLILNGAGSFLTCQLPLFSIPSESLGFTSGASKQYPFHQSPPRSERWQSPSLRHLALVGSLPLALLSFHALLKPIWGEVATYLHRHLQVTHSSANP